ncbi:Zn-ribbon domain-containing OB-fold protein [Natronococcus wangiae]|uniref:Zn-ribbon domain-containing OB-fold protein n=1 Tax=Natronococcus wangiae TaxID=3068275 RepID=UPI00273E51FC|nr:hypothetical protein [Natronococcus sp. AD5]
MSRALECADCGRRTFYTKRRCLDCGADGLRTCEPGVGTVQAVTTVHVTPEGVDQPNRLGLASFDGDANIIAALDEDLEAGDSVSLETDETDEGAESAPRLVPAETAGSRGE